MALADGRIWVIDVEGNGASPPEIVELAMVEVANLSITGNQRHWLIRPQQPIAPVASRIHGLTDVDVANAPSMDDIADSILPLIEETPIAGHNVRVEVDILARSLPDWVPSVAIDTLKLARALRPGLDSYALAKLGVQFGFEREATDRSGSHHHAALFDATLTALIFIDLIHGIPESRRQAAILGADILNLKQGFLL
ncbi:MAG: 3'-5' exonuclease [Rhodopila sp.]|nr:3'-5' exonuclease [Rhodopila sp.]